MSPWLTVNVRSFDYNFVAPRLLKVCGSLFFSFFTTAFNVSVTSLPPTISIGISSLEILNLEMALKSLNLCSCM